jgi:hypothetical protein
MNEPNNLRGERPAWLQVKDDWQALEQAFQSSCCVVPRIADALPTVPGAAGNENCAVANASQTFTGSWGWADASCRMSAPFICKSQREPRRLRPERLSRFCASAPAAATPAAATPAAALCKMRSEAPPSPLPRPAENALVPPPYTAQTSGNTFFLNITFTTHADAEANCVANGGHLAQYASYDEQKEVEQVGWRRSGLRKCG